MLNEMFFKKIILLLLFSLFIFSCKDSNTNSNHLSKVTPTKLEWSWMEKSWTGYIVTTKGILSKSEFEKISVSNNAIIKKVKLNM